MGAHATSINQTDKVRQPDGYDLYECLKTIARQEGRPIGAVLEDATRAFIENRKENIAQKSVLEALDKSMIEHDTLYKKLAK